MANKRIRERNHGPACTKCGCQSTGCTDSRGSDDLGAPSTKRRRVCTRCDHKFLTYEVPESFFNDLHETIRDDIRADIMDALFKLKKLRRLRHLRSEG